MSTDVWADMGGLYILGLELHNGATATNASCGSSSDKVCLSTVAIRVQLLGSQGGSRADYSRDPRRSLLGFGFFRRRRKS